MLSSFRPCWSPRPPKPTTGVVSVARSEPEPTPRWCWNRSRQPCSSERTQSSVLSPLGSVVLDLVPAVVASMARQPGQEFIRKKDGQNISP